MTRRRSIIGALVLCALSVCAFGAASASAGEGLTAVECVETAPGKGKFNTSHCETPESPGNFETTAFNLNETVKVEGTAEGISTLAAKISLTETIVDCTKAHTTGAVTNVTVEISKGVFEMRAHGTEAVTVYSECMARLKAKTTAEEQCEVVGSASGVITTNPLTSTTGPNHEVTFSEPSGGNIATFTIVKKAINGKVCNLPETKNIPVKGTAIADANTTKHTHLTFAGKGTLTVGGAAATYSGTNKGYMAGEPENTVSLETETEIP